MRTAIYPGSFNPWHAGHEDIVKKALKVFDRVIVAQGISITKEKPEEFTCKGILKNNEDVILDTFQGLLVDYINEWEDEFRNGKIDAVIRGLRNGNDLQYEMNLQYNNEDLGLKIPVVYFITDRTLSHISSSSVREIRKHRS